MKSKKSTFYFLLIGGRGNQLFIINAALGLLKKNPNLAINLFPFCTSVNLGVKEIIDSFKMENNRLLIEEGLFGKPAGALTRKLISAALRSSSKKSIAYRICLQIIQNCLMLALSFRSGNLVRVFVSKDLGFGGFPSMKKNTFVIGYFQSAKYGLNFQVDKKYSGPIQSKKQQGSVRVMMHVRLGDYRENPNFGILSPTYYKRILDCIVLDSPSVKLDIYTNGSAMEIAEYVSIVSDISELKVFAAEDLNESESFDKMTGGYDYYLIANSSFSFWAARLGENRIATVYYPEPWFLKQGSPSDLCPLEWIPQPARFVSG